MNSFGHIVEYYLHSKSCHLWQTCQPEKLTFRKNFNIFSGTTGKCQGHLYFSDLMNRTTKKKPSHISKVCCFIYCKRTFKYIIFYCRVSVTKIESDWEGQDELRSGYFLQIIQSTPMLKVYPWIPCEKLSKNHVRLTLMGYLVFKVRHL